MAADSTPWLVGIGLLLVALLWWRQIALSVLVICAAP